MEKLLVTGLSYTYPGSDRGIREVHFCLRHGSFTVLTGRSRAGKTTLLRVLLGFLPRQRGEIRWNDEPVQHPRAFFQLPRCAHVLGLPWLRAGPVRDNILSGPSELGDLKSLEAAIHLAGAESDIADLPYGLETWTDGAGSYHRTGPYRRDGHYPNGRLGVAQRQRLGLARALVHRPELLVVDDLARTLDAHHERALWDRILALGGMTCLVVSRRRLALQRADRILVMRDGKVEAEGTLEALLESCSEMRRIWYGEQCIRGPPVVWCPARVRAA